MATGSFQHGDPPGGPPKDKAHMGDASANAAEANGSAGEPSQEDAADGTSTDASNPEWANGLRQLYDSVVDEPLPDSFKDLLAQFDDESSDDSGNAPTPEADR